MASNNRILIFTIIEAVGLVAWLALVRTGRVVLGVGVEIVGFIAEHIVSYNVKNGKPLLSGVPWRPLLVVAGIESVAWLVWKALLPEAILAAGVLALLLLLGHALELNLVNNLPLRHNFVRRLIDSIDITLIETIGGAVTLGFIIKYGLFTPEGIASTIALTFILQEEHKRSARKIIT